ncbi:MAG: hypothetical protein R3C55_02545 [Parvularculaceae bacterium]
MTPRYEGEPQAKAPSRPSPRLIATFAQSAPHCSPSSPTASNFGNLERPGALWGVPVGAVEGMAEACEALNYPVISGNVSLYNETNGVAIRRPRRSAALACSKMRRKRPVSAARSQATS